MKNSKFRGWKDVFSFTFRQSVKKGGYCAVTLIVSLLIVAGIIFAILMSGKPDEEDVSDISVVYLEDRSGIPTDYAFWMSQLGMSRYNNTVFEPVENAETTIKQLAGSGALSYVAVVVSQADGDFSMDVKVPENADVSRGEANRLVSDMITCFETNKLLAAGLSEEQLIGVMSPTISDYSKFGEEKNVAVELIRVFAPMVFGLVLYLMLILYGQEVGREVSAEKTSKLTEMLLTSVQPYALIAGKVLAISLAAMLQFFIWVASAVIGVTAGNAIAQDLYPGYQNVVTVLFEFLRENLGANAFTIPSVVIGLVVFCVGFLFYCVLAGIAGSLVSKPEEMASTQAIFQFPVIISFFVTYFAAIAEKFNVIAVSRYIPFTAPFSVPVDVITGSIGPVSALISLAILIVFAILLIIVAGRLYEGMILYTGQKVNFQTVIGIITAKKTIRTKDNQ